MQNGYAVEVGDLVSKSPNPNKSLPATELTISARGNPCWGQLLCDAVALALAPIAVDLRTSPARTERHEALREIP